MTDAHTARDYEIERISRVLHEEINTGDASRPFITLDTRTRIAARIIDEWLPRHPTANSLTDSPQLNDLRHRFTKHHRRPLPKMTPRRLGAFAAEHGIVITDFGAHSKRWIRHFREGRMAAKPADTP